MGERTRNRYTKEFKFKGAISAIKGENQVSELAAVFKVHQTQIRNWKPQLVEQGARGIQPQGWSSTPGDSSRQRGFGQDDRTSDDLDRLVKKKLGISESWRSVQ